MPFHWGGEQSINRLTNPALDPISRMPEFKVCAVNLQPVLARVNHPGARPSGRRAICDCNGVTRSRIVEAVLNGARSLQAVCDATRAGTGCGSCRLEVQTVIDATCRRLDSTPAKDRPRQLYANVQLPRRVLSNHPRWELGVGSWKLTGSDP